MQTLKPNQHNQIEPNSSGAVLLTGVDTAGSFTLVSLTLPPFSPPADMHRHAEHAEGYYVLAGKLAVTHGEATTMLAAGGSTLVPPGVAHTCWNPTATPTTVLLIYTPGCDENEANVLTQSLGAANPATYETWR